MWNLFLKQNAKQSLTDRKYRPTSKLWGIIEIKWHFHQKSCSNAGINWPHIFLDKMQKNNYMRVENMCSEGRDAKESTELGLVYMKITLEAYCCKAAAVILSERYLCTWNRPQEMKRDETHCQKCVVERPGWLRLPFLELWLSESQARIPSVRYILWLHYSFSCHTL